MSNSNDWKLTDDPPKENKIIWVYDTKAVFDTRKQRLLYYRTEDGFPKGITHWKEKPKDPEQ